MPGTDFDPDQSWAGRMPMQAKTAPSSTDFARLETRLDSLGYRMERGHEAQIERMDRIAEAVAQVAALHASVAHVDQRTDAHESRINDLTRQLHDIDHRVLTMRTELSAWERTGKALWAGTVALVAGAAWLWEKTR
ncbi:MAG: hypothetical protein AB9M53_00365 [Leptothrix sp. (in: b-proteobacteria)]